MERDLEQAFARLHEAIAGGQKEAMRSLDHLRDCLYGSDGHEGDIVEIKRCLAELPCAEHERLLAQHVTTLSWHTWFWRGLVASAITGGGIALGAGKAGAQAVLHIASRL